MSGDLDAFLAAQTRASLAGVAACLSRTDLVMVRAGFGQRVVPAPGSVLASPVTRLSEGQPDYFFHWLRDSALAMACIRAVHAAGDGTRDWPGHWRDFVRFSLNLNRLRWRPDPGLVTRARPDFRQFLRDEAELLALDAATLPGEVRVTPDGTIDPIRWSRPQHDGPALRALTALDWWRDGDRDPATAALIEADLRYTLATAGEPSVDIWEEHAGRHYYTMLAQHAALARGSDWGEGALASDLAAAAGRLALDLDRCRQPDGTIAWSLPGPDGAPPGAKCHDIQVILAVLHAGDDGAAAHSVRDPAIAATLARLEDEALAYPINRDRPAGHGIVQGRYRGDVYGTAGPWYLTSFAAAEYRYRRAVAGDGDRASLIADGDAVLRAVRATIPPDGALSEQFDPATGAQSSAADLGWSHAAFLTAALARQRALAPAE